MTDDVLERATWLSAQRSMSPTQLEELALLAPEVESRLPDLSGDDFARAVLSLVRPMERAGRIGELSSLLVQASSTALEASLRGWVRLRQAEVYFANGEAANALKVLESVPHGDDQRLRLACSYVRALCLRDTSQFEAAFATVEEGMGQAVELGDHYTRILLLNVRGGILYRKASFEAAIDDFEMALHLAQKFSPPTARSVRSNLAYACRGARRYERAIRELEPILGPEDTDSFIALSALSTTYALSGNLDAAEKSLDRATRLSQRGHWRSGESELWLARWIIEASRGKKGAAVAALEQLTRMSNLEVEVE